MKNKAAVTSKQVKYAALAACSMLVQAYKNGEDDGGSMEWSDVDQAWEQAKRALLFEKQAGK